MLLTTPLLKRLTCLIIYGLIFLSLIYKNLLSCLNWKILKKNTLSLRKPFQFSKGKTLVSYWPIFTMKRKKVVDLARSIKLIWIIGRLPNVMSRELLMFKFLISVIKSSMVILNKPFIMMIVTRSILKQDFSVPFK